MALRKDTKKYKRLVFEYCTARGTVEYRKIDVKNAETALEESKKAFAELPAEIQSNENIKRWYNTHIDILKTSLSLSRGALEERKKLVELYEPQLLSDYKADVDKLYELNKGVLFEEDVVVV